MLVKILSGGQTGADQAALDIAIRNGIAHGGWCPAGWLAEDGVLDPCYRLAETPTADYAQRTEWNIRDTDGTLILNRGRLHGGTALTVEQARRLDKPCLVVDPDTDTGPGILAQEIISWLKQHDIAVLNVAGPRASRDAGIYDRATGILQQILDRLRES